MVCPNDKTIRRKTISFVAEFLSKLSMKQQYIVVEMTPKFIRSDDAVVIYVLFDIFCVIESLSTILPV